MTSATEPAVKSYFFGKGYRDLWATIQESWKRNLASSGAHFGVLGTLSGGELADKVQAVFRIAAGVSVVVFGTVFFVATSLLHVAALAIVFLLVYVGFTFVLLAERGYLTVRRFSTACPACHSRAAVPEYLCPGCGAAHRRLIPSSYGILHHQCTCGRRLPATFFLDRGQLTSRCPQCQEILRRSHTESKKAFVPIVGGVSAGKTAFLFSAVRSLVDEHLPQRGLAAAFLEEPQEADYRRVCGDLDRGTPPNKTFASLPRAINIELRRVRGANRVLYLYDPAGEAFDTAESLQLHKYQEYLSGLVLLIDPFSIPALRAELGERLTAAEGGLRPSRALIADSLTTVLIAMENGLGLNRGKTRNIPVAVVLTKIDAFELEHRIDGAMAGSAALSEPDRRSEAVRSLLERWDQQDFVDQVESRFRTVRYFACTSLGRSPDGSATPFIARGVADPLLWLLDDAAPDVLGGSARWQLPAAAALALAGVLGLGGFLTLRADSPQQADRVTATVADVPAAPPEEVPAPPGPPAEPPMPESYSGRLTLPAGDDHFCQLTLVPPPPRGQESFKYLLACQPTLLWSGNVTLSDGRLDLEDGPRFVIEEEERRILLYAQGQYSGQLTGYFAPVETES